MIWGMRSAPSRPAISIGHAERAFAAGDFDWACLACQQAAEKGLKAVLLHSGLPANPVHNLSKLYDALVGGGVAEPGAKAALQAHLSFLTLAFTFARYPDAEADAAPAELVTAAEATRALTGATAVLAECRRLASELDAE